MAKSIIQTDKSTCFLCGSNRWIEEHHCFSGVANKKMSEKYGLKIYVCHYCHNEPPNGIHHNKAVRLRVQAIAQRAAMERYEWSEDEFRAIFGRSYL